MMQMMSMKFGTDIMPLEATQNSHLRSSSIGNTNVTDAKITDAGGCSFAMTPLPMILHDDVMMSSPVVMS
jgi:hypothetical protein